jgi:hypothetical protein
VAQLYPQAFDSLYVAFYDSQGGIRTFLHRGIEILTDCKIAARVLARTLSLRSESHGTHDHILQPDEFLILPTNLQSNKLLLALASRVVLGFGPGRGP